MPSVQIPPNQWNNKKYCDLDKADSPHIICDPHIKYSRIDGKCNNLENANWGSSFHCHRRLLPPDYQDGIVRPRASLDGSPLPSPRLITELLMPDLELYDPKRTAMNMIWGQFLVHDVFRTIQYLGLAIDCCRSPNRFVHPECIPITNFPPDRATTMFNQRCINTVRSTACNTCSLGKAYI
jgi:peroxidase